MKQLLHSCPLSPPGDDAVAVGLGSAAVLILPAAGLGGANRLVHLPLQHTEGDEVPGVLAVAVSPDGDNGGVVAAVARGDKTLSLYRVGPTDDAAEAHPAVLLTTRRISCLAFTSVLPETEAGTPEQIVLCGDYTGDVHAFPAGRGAPAARRLMLGHTASMLTCMALEDPFRGDGGGDRGTLLVTGDRDERIRLSRFPQTHEIAGYCLGHDGSVTCVDVGRVTGSGLVVSGSGDGTVRVWDAEDEGCVMASYGWEDTGEKNGSRAAVRSVSMARDESGLVCVVREGKECVEVLSLKRKGERSDGNNGWKLELSEIVKAVGSDVDAEKNISQPIALTALSCGSVLALLSGFDGCPKFSLLSPTYSEEVLSMVDTTAASTLCIAFSSTFFDGIVLPKTAWEITATAGMIKKAPPVLDRMTVGGNNIGSTMNRLTAANEDRMDKFRVKNAKRKRLKNQKRKLEKEEMDKESDGAGEGNNDIDEGNTTQASEEVAEGSAEVKKIENGDELAGKKIKEIDEARMEA